MSESKTQPPFVPPVSNFTGPVAELIGQRMLQPPSRPGLLASLDHFEILRVLGGGGMGIVLLARDTEADRDVAIKLVKTDLVNDQHVVHRFLKEAGHLKRLRHTNIVPVSEISDRPECPYFVMPYFEKGSLANRIQPGQGMDAESILDIATQLAEGLSFAHRSGIIHRDLKPANILLGSDGKVCLADFGLARTVFNDTIVDVESRQMEGTAPYMSPAVAAGDAEDTRCDIYSFGALLYEMLTGQPPYQGRGTKEILDQIIVGPPKPISTVRPGADRALAAVAEKAMARELRDRYADMRDVLNDLRQISEGKPPTAQTHGEGGWLRHVWIPIVAAAAAFFVWALWPQRPAPMPAPAPVSRPTPVAAAPAPGLQPVTHPAQSQPVTTPPAAQPIIPSVPASPVTLATLAGQPGLPGFADGVGSQAQFRLPNSLAVDRTGIVYVADTANNVIRKVMPDGTVTTLAGLPAVGGSADGIGSQARFMAPFGVAVDGAGNVYVADTANNTIRKITPAGVVSTLAGMAGRAGSEDGAGSAARFRNPWGLAVDGGGNVYVADMSNNTIRRITPAGVVTTVAGRAGSSGYSNGLGGSALFDRPFAVAADAAGDVFVSDTANSVIRKITPAGEVMTLAGLAGVTGQVDALGAGARFHNPQGLAVDAGGNVFVADAANDTIRRITPAGVVSALLPLAGTNAVAAPLHNPCGVAVDAAGTLYVVDTNNHCVRKLMVSR